MMICLWSPEPEGEDSVSVFFFLVLRPLGCVLLPKLAWILPPRRPRPGGGRGGGRAVGSEMRESGSSFSYDRFL